MKFSRFKDEFIRHTGFYSLFLLSLIQTGLIALFHKTLIQVLVVAGIVSACLFGINSIWVYRHQGEGDQC